MDRKSKFFDSLAVLVASGQAVVSAAESIGCATSTAYRIASQADFQQRVSELRTDSLRLAMGRLSGLACSAAERLGQLLDGPDPSVALRASTSILDRFSKLSETIDLRARVEALELARKTESTT